MLAAVSLEALRGSIKPFDARIHDVRGAPFVLLRFEVLDASRRQLTPVGRVLRATALDGLPQVLQLLNILFQLAESGERTGAEPVVTVPAGG